MRRIDGVTSAPVTGGSQAKPAGQSRFAVAAGNQPVESAAPAPAALPVGLAGMLALQETEAETVKNRNGKRHGLAVLDALRDLQLGLLGANGSAGDIAFLAQLAEKTPFVLDDRLAELLAAIRLRAKIELLRRVG